MKFALLIALLTLSLPLQARAEDLFLSGDPIRAPIASPIRAPIQGPVTGGGSCPLNLSGSHGQISQCSQAFSQCQNSCKSQQCAPMACAETEVCTVDSTGTRACHGIPCNVQTCSQQSQGCATQCKSTYSSCVGQIGQGVEQACGAPPSPSQCQNWGQGLSDHECGRQKQTCESRCALNDGGCRYNCIYSQVKCHERLKSDLAVVCNQPQPEVVSQPASPIAPIVDAPVAREPASLAVDRIQ